MPPEAGVGRAGGSPDGAEDPVTVVIGGTSGLGLATSVALAEEGRRTIAAARGSARLQQVRTLAAAKSLPLTVHPVDVTSAQSVRELFAHAESQGPVAACVNAAGQNLSRLLLSRRDQNGEWRLHPEEEWRATIELCLTGTFLVGRQVAELMARQGAGGVLVNIASSTWSGSWGQSAYAAAKAGVVSLTRSWALELADHGIRVVCVAPGVVDGTALRDKCAANPGHARFMDRLRERVPLRRFAAESEVAASILHAIDNEYLTGNVMEVHGGGFPSRIV